MLKLILHEVNEMKKRHGGNCFKQNYIYVNKDLMVCIKQILDIFTPLE